MESTITFRKLKMQSSTITSAITNLVVMYGAATLGSVVAILLLTRDMETIGAAVLGPLFALPAIACYVLLVHAHCSKITCNYVYWIVGLPLPLYWICGSFFSTPRVRSDGADDMAFIVAVCVLAAAVAAYLADQFWRKKNIRS